MMGFQQENEKYTALVNERLETHLSEASLLPRLSEIMRYSLFPGGKRLRPCMTLAVCGLFGGDAQAALPVACALEMIHTYSLIHDDLPCMDDDDFRHSKPSSHKVFGEGLAVLAGDGLLSLAFEVMTDGLAQYGAQAPGYLNAISAVARGAGVYGMVAGQVMDLALEGAPLTGADALQAVHRNKTGAMLKAALLSGAYIAGAKAHELQSISAFAEHFGVLFQMTDDILDVTGSFKRMGKTIGKDERAMKLTYPALFGLENAQCMAKETAQAALACLDGLGENAGYLRRLTEFTLERNH